MPNPTESPGLVQTCRDLRDDLEQLFKLSPLLAFSAKGRVAVHRTQTLLEQLEDLSDRVTLIETQLREKRREP